MGFRGGRGEEGGSGLGFGLGRADAIAEVVGIVTRQRSAGFFGHFGKLGASGGDEFRFARIDAGAELRVGLGAGRGVNRLGCDGGRGRGEEVRIGLASV